MFRISIAGATALLLAACTGTVPTGTAAVSGAHSAAPAAQHAATPPSPATRASAESLADFAKRIRVECEAQGANLDCIGGKPENGDIYDVELRPDCGADGFFGGVANDAGAELRDALPPKDKSTPAILAPGQLVCIEAIGRAGQDPAYFYVATVPVADVPACHANPLCSAYGDRRTRGWKGAATQCRIASNSRPTDDCPQGWVRREDIEDFSNGM